MVGLSPVAYTNPFPSVVVSRGDRLGSTLGQTGAFLDFANRVVTAELDWASITWLPDFSKTCCTSTEITMRLTKRESQRLPNDAFNFNAPLNHHPRQHTT